jgi:hypothetical protein
MDGAALSLVCCHLLLHGPLHDNMPRKPGARSHREPFPEVRRASFSDPFDHSLWHIGEQLRKDDEHSVVLKEMSYKRKKVHFAVWLSYRVWVHSQQDVFIAPFGALIVALVLLALVVHLSIPALIPLGIVGGYLAFRRAGLAGARKTRLWENATGFLVLDEGGEPIRARDDYDDYFQAYATWEEAFFRPVVLQKMSKRVRRQLSEIRRLAVQSAKSAKLPEPLTELDRQVTRTNQVLTKSAQGLNPLLDEEERLVTEIQNLSLRISEDYIIRRAELIGKLRTLQKLDEKIEKLLLERADAYDFWLVLLAGKGLNLRYTHRGALIAVGMGSVSAVLTRSLTPLTSISFPFLRYLADYLGGVRSLNRGAKKRARLKLAIEDYVHRLSPKFNPSMVRLPSARVG